MTQRENETSLVRSIKNLFKNLRIPFYVNYQGYHTRGGDRGRPDLEAIYLGVTYFIECKHPKTGGKMNAYQQEHRDMIQRAGAPYILAKTVEDVVEAMKLPVLVT